MATLAALFWITVFALCVFLSIRIYSAIDPDCDDRQILCLLGPGIIFLVTATLLSGFGLIFSIPAYSELFNDQHAFDTATLQLTTDLRFYILWGLANLVMGIIAAAVAITFTPGFKDYIKRIGLPAYGIILLIMVLFASPFVVALMQVFLRLFKTMLGK